MPTAATLSDVYEDVKDTIEKTAGRFARSYRRDYEETLAEANFLFVRAFLSFRPGGNLDRRVGYLVWNGLLDGLKAEIRRHVRTTPLTPDEARLPAPPVFCRDEFEECLSDDARALVGLALDDAPGLDEIIRRGPTTNPWTIRRCLVRHVLGGMGWTKKRLLTTSAEIGDALRG
jgi:hypothetical protein